MTATMKAWQYASVSGGLEKNLQIKTDVPQPTIGDDEILVEVHSMALNPVDYKATEAGLPLTLMGSTLIPGADFSGEVFKIGRNVDSFQIGERVFGAKVGALAKGSLAQYISVGKEMLAKLPEGVSMDDAAAIGIVGLTEYQSIAPNVQAGDKVFINGGSGGTGIHGIQIAKALGCHVTTTCSTPNVDLCKSVGADEVIDYKSTDIVTALSERGQIFKLVLDNVGTPADLYKKSASFLIPSGKFVQVGAGTNLGTMGQVATNFLLPSFLGGGKNKYQLLMAQPSAENLKQLGVWMKEGNVRSVLDQVFEWEDAPKAFEKLKTGRARGKIVIHVQ
ncbi:GroES-like protein [Dothidotthia symphoricarpi CBS 119687]|uniref:GroES-like protein n=1 Tax=Dothidotthia symphoricarpi CBS 119687 TaxID=1392245 RepID=A0A6A5ZWG9_9PLEO|nr:GroES-like protein [Dothidotthia symphoricarpi CBS 119687]KAF2123879.1 GroES-like protein [Dothidotthia symphoricarpi CBS 119687]